MAQVGYQDFLKALLSVNDDLSKSDVKVVELRVHNATERLATIEEALTLLLRRDAAADAGEAPVPVPPELLQALSRKSRRRS